MLGFKENTVLRAVYRRLRKAMPAVGRDFLDLTGADNGYLKQSGWQRSRREWMAVDRNGGPIPWYTYPAIRFLEERVPATAEVFEFGLGNSTLWWASRTQRVVSVEGDAEWHRQISSLMSDKVTGLLCDVESDAYVSALAGNSMSPDIIVIDGRRRVECCRRSVDLLKSTAVVVWDNSDRERYEEGYRILGDRGFKRVDFWGLGPINNYGWCTSVFYRSDNCLGL